MSAKTEHLQIRVTPLQKAALKRQARAAGRDLSSHVLAQLVPPGRDRFGELLTAIGAEFDARYALAELNDFLFSCPPIAFGNAVAVARCHELSPYLQNYVAAMVEQAAAMKGVEPPSWVREVLPLETPRFATSLRSLRLHLLRSAPVPFKRRNIFVDAGVGARV